MTYLRSIRCTAVSGELSQGAVFASLVLVGPRTILALLDQQTCHLVSTYIVRIIVYLLSSLCYAQCSHCAICLVLRRSMATSYVVHARWSCPQTRRVKRMQPGFFWAGKEYQLSWKACSSMPSGWRTTAWPMGRHQSWLSQERS